MLNPTASELAALALTADAVEQSFKRILGKNLTQLNPKAPLEVRAMFATCLSTILTTIETNFRSKNQIPREKEEKGPFFHKIYQEAFDGFLVCYDKASTSVAPFEDFDVNSIDAPDEVKESLKQTLADIPDGMSARVVDPDKLWAEVIGWANNYHKSHS